MQAVNPVHDEANKQIEAKHGLATCVFSSASVAEGHSTVRGRWDSWSGMTNWMIERNTTIPEGEAKQQVEGKNGWDLACNFSTGAEQFTRCASLRLELLFARRHQHLNCWCFCTARPLSLDESTWIDFIDDLSSAESKGHDYQDDGREVVASTIRLLTMQVSCTSTRMMSTVALGEADDDSREFPTD